MVGKANCPCRIPPGRGMAVGCFSQGKAQTAGLALGVEPCGCSGDVFFHKYPFFNAHITSKYHRIPFLAQNPELSSCSLRGSLRVQDLPAFSSHGNDTMDIPEVDLDSSRCERLHWAESKNPKSSKTGLLFRGETTEQNQLTSSATSERHLGTNSTL